MVLFIFHFSPVCNFGNFVDFGIERVNEYFRCNIFCCCMFTELEALEACYWLKAAGFPQYAQAYEGASCGFLSLGDLAYISGKSGFFLNESRDFKMLRGRCL